MSLVSQQTKRLKTVSESDSEFLCPLCCTKECTQESTSSQESSAGQTTIDQTVSCLPPKETIGQLIQVPNEVLSIIVQKMSLKDLSNLSITNKWFRDFILQNIIETKSGLPSLLGSIYLAKNASTTELQCLRLKLFHELGLLLKRVTCLCPTNERIETMVRLFARLDGIPRISLNPIENQNMRFVFQCYGRLLRHLVSGWDDCELKSVFKRLQQLNQLKELIRSVTKKPIGALTSTEYYIRSFYRMVCIDPNRPNPSADKSKSPDDDRVFWLKAIITKKSLEIQARLLMIIFGPLISQSPIPTSNPYIGYWDLTDTFFIYSGLEDLGDAIRLLYSYSETPETRNNVMSLMDTIMKIPTNWLSENMASLLFYAGDEITFDYLMSKMETGNYSDVAQKLVFLTLVTHKLTKETKYVYNLIEELATKEHRLSLYNEIPIAFCEAITDIENAIELEDERDVLEVHEIIEANNDLLKNFMVKPKDESSQESKCSQSHKHEIKSVVGILAQNEE